MPKFPPGFLVLHVEDDAVLRKTVELRVFRRLGVKPLWADTGARCVDMVLAEGLEPTVILMDNQMPSLTGAAATRALRQAGYEGEIIGMTGDPSGCVERDDFEASGLNFCLDKTKEGLEAVAAHLRDFALVDDNDSQDDLASRDSDD